MLLTYDALDLTEVRGRAPVDVLAGVDAGFRVVDGDRVVYEDPSFPVVELAWSLLRWLDQPDRGDFVFDSMSFEEPGALTVRRQGAGWVFGSVFVPDVASDPVSWGEVERSVRAFTRRVTADLTAVGLDATDALRYPPAR
ncbi:hypothetical protein EV645_3438 [Kribbella rubisoli]|uniref:DUF7878 domain-containing protein n=1 Tax=Kribbella rubisoli TaxID=3075929 RepID=A0A4Q7X019_9ACTN|nr:hypothetical protein EV645_3438 [Kribbella rubisoli]